jgi:hypothetical protein
VTATRIPKENENKNTPQINCSTCNPTSVPTPQPSNKPNSDSYSYPEGFIGSQNADVVKIIKCRMWIRSIYRGK